MRKNVVVFGGAGFLGGYVAEELKERGYRVVVADIRKSKYVDDSMFVECNILDRKHVFEVVNGADFVYNFAGIANLDTAVDIPLTTVELNVMGNMNILEACRSLRVERVIYASSAYAMSGKGSFYGISKLTSEKLVEEYFRKFGLRFTVVRYGSVYGERDFGNNYIYNLIREAIDTNEIRHNGDGEEVREYIHVADAAKLSVDILEDEGFVNEHVILTGSERMKRKELFEMIGEILGSDLKISLLGDGYKHHYKITPYAFQPTKSKKLVANPYIDMGQGLLECIKDVYSKKNGSEE